MRDEEVKDNAVVVNDNHVPWCSYIFVASKHNRQNPPSTDLKNKATNQEILISIDARFICILEAKLHLGTTDNPESKSRTNKVFMTPRKAGKDGILKVLCELFPLTDPTLASTNPPTPDNLGGEKPLAAP